MAKHRIRTKKRPFEVIEVEGPELLALTSQGLVLTVEDDEPAAPVEPVPAEDEPQPAVPAQRTRKTSNGGK